MCVPWYYLHHKATSLYNIASSHASRFEGMLSRPLRSHAGTHSLDHTPWGTWSPRWVKYIAFANAMFGIGAPCCMMLLVWHPLQEHTPLHRAPYEHTYVYFAMVILYLLVTVGRLPLVSSSGHVAFGVFAFLSVLVPVLMSVNAKNYEYGRCDLYGRDGTVNATADEYFNFNASQIEGCDQGSEQVVPAWLLQPLDLLYSIMLVTSSLWLQVRRDFLEVMWLDECTGEGTEMDFAKARRAVKIVSGRHGDKDFMDLAPDVSGWKLVGAMFEDGISLFEGVPLGPGDGLSDKLSAWDMSGITSTEAMFCGAADFDADLSRWDVSSVQSMERMFDGAKSFTGPLFWRSSSVCNVKNMRRSEWGTADSPRAEVAQRTPPCAQATRLQAPRALSQSLRGPHVLRVESLVIT